MPTAHIRPQALEDLAEIAIVIAAERPQSAEAFLQQARIRIDHFRS